MICLWQRTIKLQNLGSSCKWASNCFSMDSIKLSLILDCFGDQITIKNTKTYTIWLETIAKVLNMLIELKGNNYYSKVFKRVNYKLSNSTFWVVINFLSLWHLSQLLHMVWASLKSDGQLKPDCNTFMVVFWEAKWPPHVFSWQWLRIPYCSCSGTHFLIIWSAQYLQRKSSSQ